MEKFSKAVGKVAAKKIDADHGNELAETFTEVIESMDPSSRTKLKWAFLVLLVVTVVYMVRHGKTPRDLKVAFGFGS